MPDAFETFPLRLTAYQVSNKYKVCCSSSTPWTASIFPPFDTLLLSILFSNLARLVLLYILCWNSHKYQLLKSHLGCWLLPGRGEPLCVTKLVTIELTDVFWTKRRWTVPVSCKLVCAFWGCEQSNVVALFFLGHPVIQQQVFKQQLKTFWFCYKNTHTYATVLWPFSGTTRVSQCQKRTSGLHGARGD